MVNAMIMKEQLGNAWNVKWVASKRVLKNVLEVVSRYKGGDKKLDYLIFSIVTFSSTIFRFVQCEVLRVHIMYINRQGKGEQFPK